MRAMLGALALSLLVMGGAGAQVFALTRSVVVPNRSGPFPGEMYMTVSSDDVVVFQLGRWSFGCSAKALPDLTHALQKVGEETAQRGAQTMAVDLGKVDEVMMSYHRSAGGNGYLMPGILPLDLVPAWQQLIGMYPEARKEVDAVAKKKGG